MIYPEKFEQKIEFDKIKTLIQAECLCEMGKEEIAALAFLPTRLLSKPQQDKLRNLCVL